VLALASYAAFGLAVHWLAGYWATVDRFGDNHLYAGIAAALRGGDLRAVGWGKHFWGLPAAAAGVGVLTGLGDLAAILAVSMAASLASIALAERLWGGRVAALFAVINWPWIHGSVLGGTETLFVALLTGSFWAARRDRWALAGLLAALSGITRPVGVLAVISVAGVLLWRRQWHRLAAAVAATVAVGGLHAVSFQVAFGDPFANLRGYQGEWAGSWPIGFPFVTLARGFLESKEPWTNTAKILVWVVLVLAGGAAMLLRPRFRRYARTHPPEALFAALAFAFLWIYNAQKWSWAEFPRFAIPVLPFALYAVEDWWPRSRLLLWAMALGSAMLAAASAVNARYAWEQFRQLW